MGMASRGWQTKHAATAVYRSRHASRVGRSSGAKMMSETVQNGQLVVRPAKPMPRGSGGRIIERKLIKKLRTRLLNGVKILPVILEFTPESLTAFAAKLANMEYQELTYRETAHPPPLEHRPKIQANAPSYV